MAPNEGSTMLGSARLSTAGFGAVSTAGDLPGLLVIIDLGIGAHRIERSRLRRETGASRRAVLRADPPSPVAGTVVGDTVPPTPSIGTVIGVVGMMIVPAPATGVAGTGEADSAGVGEVVAPRISAIAWAVTSSLFRAES